MNITATASSQIEDIVSRICGTLQLTDVQHDTADGHYKDVAGWLAAPDSPLFNYQPHIYPQGSFLSRTTVRPILYNEFDLDFVVEMDLDYRLNSPDRVLKSVKQRLDANPRYQTELMKRCVRLHFPGFHVDVLPGIPHREFGTTVIHVPDRKLAAWLSSNPKGFAAWFDGRASLPILLKLEGIERLPDKEPAEFKARLRKVVQLIKRWRDVRYKDRCKLAPISIVLTTLAGLSFRPKDGLYEAMDWILESMASLVASHPKPFAVVNPVNPDEVLSEKWFSEPDSYKWFSIGIRDFHEQWKALSALRGLHEIQKALAVLFGAEPAKRAVADHHESISQVGRNGRFHMERSTGLLSATAAALTLSSRKHTFFGD